MPLNNILYLDVQSQIGFWQIKESVEQLKQQCVIKPDLLTLLPNMVEQRQKELLAVRCLLLTMTQNPNLYIQYDDCRNPFLSDEYQTIAITHAQNRVGLFLSKQNKQALGLDLEYVSERISRLQQKFMNEQELAFVQNDLVKATLIWSAKETLYKLYGKKGLDFRNNMQIDHFVLSKKGHFMGTIKNEILHQSFKIRYLVEKERVLTYCQDALNWREEYD